jgi:hypothetical protein
MENRFAAANKSFPYSWESSFSKVVNGRRTPSRSDLLQILIWGLEIEGLADINRVLKLAEYEVLSKKEIENLADRISTHETPAKKVNVESTAIAFSEQSTSFTIAEAEEAVSSTEALYEYPGGRVSAIRLYGAAEQCLAPKQITVQYEASSFPISREFRVAGEQRVRDLIERRDRGEIEFFDGPCARLVSLIKPSFEYLAQDGRKELKLVVGPIGWYDVERTNGVLRGKLLRGEKIDYEHWIGLSTLAHQGKVEQSRLSNIVGNAITIFTTDRQVGFQDRGERQSVGAKQLSSAVAENLHRYFDDTKPGNPSHVLHPLPPDKKLSDGPDNEKCPPVTGVLHPAAAVRRGITEETSYKMTDCIPEGGIKCTGLCFSLDALQPDLLWIVLVQLTAEQFTRKCRTEHGRDWREGRIRFVPADFKDAETQRVLARTDWIAAGKASLVRAIELIDVLGYQRGAASTKIFNVIRRHTSL